jgi:hypothetical protein
MCRALQHPPLFSNGNGAPGFKGKPRSSPCPLPPRLLLAPCSEQQPPMARPASPIVRPPHSMALRARSALSFARRVLLLPHARARRPAETKAPSPSCPPWLLPLRGKRGLPLSLDARRSGHGRPAPRLSARRPALLQVQAPLHLPGAGNSQVQAPRTPIAASLSIAAELPYFPSHGAELQLPISLRTCSNRGRRSHFVPMTGGSRFKFICVPNSRFRNIF